MQASLVPLGTPADHLLASLHDPFTADDHDVVHAWLAAGAPSATAATPRASRRRTCFLIRSTPSSFGATMVHGTIVATSATRPAGANLRPPHPPLHQGSPHPYRIHP